MARFMIVGFLIVVFGVMLAVVGNQFPEMAEFTWLGVTAALLGLALMALVGRRMFIDRKKKQPPQAPRSQPEESGPE